jgi:hypothetical protein
LFAILDILKINFHNLHVALPVYSSLSHPYFSALLQVISNSVIRDLSLVLSANALAISRGYRRRKCNYSLESSPRQMDWKLQRKHHLLHTILTQDDPSRTLAPSMHYSSRVRRWALVAFLHDQLLCQKVGKLYMEHIMDLPILAQLTSIVPLQITEYSFFSIVFSYASCAGIRSCYRLSCSLPALLGDLKPGPEVDFCECLPIASMVAEVRQYGKSAPQRA